MLEDSTIRESLLSVRDGLPPGWRCEYTAPVHANGGHTLRCDFWIGEGIESSLYYTVWNSGYVDWEACPVWDGLRVIPGHGEYTSLAEIEVKLLDLIRKNQPPQDEGPN